MKAEESYLTVRINIKANETRIPKNYRIKPKNTIIEDIATKNYNSNYRKN